MKGRPVFMDGPVVTKTCPVLAFTAEVREWLWWFERCYVVQAVGMAGASCVRVSLPEAGGVADQDVRLLMALEHMAGTLNQVIREQGDRRRA